MKSKYILTSASILGAIAVALGAFAAHSLKSQLPPYLVEVFNTGVHYQFIHVLALLTCGILIRHTRAIVAQKYFYRAAVCFIIGILCFSGSLYALALTGIKWFGPITPFGGLLFIFGWGILAVGTTKLDEVNS